MSTNYNTNYKQHKEIIFAEKEENKTKYYNNIYTLDTC